MPVVDLHDTAYAGTVTSGGFAHARGPRSYAECTACGSSLAGRCEGFRMIAGVRTLVYRCRCGRGHHVRREVAA